MLTSSFTPKVIAEQMQHTHILGENTHMKVRFARSKSSPNAGQ